MSPKRFPLRIDDKIHVLQRDPIAGKLVLVEASVSHRDENGIRACFADDNEQDFSWEALKPEPPAGLYATRIFAYDPIRPSKGGYWKFRLQNDTLIVYVDIGIQVRVNPIGSLHIFWWDKFRSLFKPISAHFLSREISPSTTYHPLHLPL